MEYKVGQEIVVKSRKGPLLWNFRRGFYDYNGTRIKDAPLGIKGIVKEVYENDASIRLANGLTRHFINEEIELSEAERKRIAAELQRQRELEEILRLQEKEAEEEARRAGSIEVLLTLEEPVSRDTVEEDRSFKPGFNPREEFALWLRKQFPDLPASQYFSNYERTEEGWKIEYPGSYKFPKKRREEIYRAALLACDHGVRTSNGCVQGYFKSCLDGLDKNFDKAVFCLLNLIENVSANLPHERVHYGTHVKVGG